MKKTTTFFVVLLGIALLAFITKPSEYECRQIATEHKMKSFDFPLFKGLAKKIVNKGIFVEDRVIYKHISFVYDGEVYNIGWAAFGQVFMN